jgi:hypothetical protein
MRAKRTIVLSDVAADRSARGAIELKTLSCIAGCRKYSRDLTSAWRVPHTDRSDEGEGPHRDRTFVPGSAD